MIGFFLFICALMLGIASWLICDMNRMTKKAKKSL